MEIYIAGKGACQGLDRNQFDPITEGVMNGPSHYDPVGREVWKCRVL